MSQTSTDVLAVVARAVPELEQVLGQTIDVARPPTVWPSSLEPAEVERVVRSLASSLGTTTGTVTLLISNIVVEPFEDEHDVEQVPPPGHYVGLSIKGPTLEPGTDGLILDLAEYAYRRAVDDEAAVVAFLPAIP